LLGEWRGVGGVGGAAASGCYFRTRGLSFPLGSPSANDIKSIVINAWLITLVAMATQLIICTYYYAHANLGYSWLLHATEQVGLRSVRAR